MGSDSWVFSLPPNEEIFLRCRRMRPSEAAVVFGGGGLGLEVAP